ncbi:hypothetical protein GJ744_001736 [Endocarpon pusillum]|uniref:N-acetyltransferase domain-containing protein n=1 Tax=Endocarpon pusillum TaxID=364733 RepID=A0A8H7A9S1_9EURO|nr:hypothetical protein GJ744_001736 [Endocarpon pusillum]
MPAMLDDPTAPVIYRASGAGPYPTANNPQIPSSIFPRPVTLRDRVTVATLVPFFSPNQVPGRLRSYLCDQLNKEIEGGDTYPMINPLPYEAFGPYWFGNFGAVMLLGDIGGIESVQAMEHEGSDWSKICLGSFYVKPNYPGRSSHVCNGGFLVTPAARNKGVGKSMGECYLDWAPQLGYTYSVFNLVYETNTASTRIWDSLGFKRIGRIPACGNLRSSTELVDAIIYGRDLGPGGEDFVSEERFDKIRYYLKHNNYPTGADRAEKSRLRSAATHYKLVGGEDGEPERLMLKDKEVISDPQNQYEIARQAHTQAHGGINKTTAMIATKYHWVRIKETVSMVIKNCTECKEAGKASMARPDSSINHAEQPKASLPPSSSLSSAAQSRPQPHNSMETENRFISEGTRILAEHSFEHKQDPFSTPEPQNMHGPVPGMEDYPEMAIDPQIMQQLHQQMNSQYQHPDDAYESAGMAHFNDAPPMHAHHGHSGEYHVDESDDHLMAHAAAAASMDLVDGSHLDHEEQIPQHLLQGGYVDNDGNVKFDQ